MSTSKSHFAVPEIDRDYEVCGDSIASIGSNSLHTQTLPRWQLGIRSLTLAFHHQHDLQTRGTSASTSIHKSSDTDQTRQKCVLQWSWVMCDVNHTW